MRIEVVPTWLLYLSSNNFLHDTVWKVQYGIIKSVGLLDLWEAETLALHLGLTVISAFSIYVNVYSFTPRFV